MLLVKLRRDCRHALLCYQTLMNLAHETHRRRQVCLVQSHSYSSSCPLCGRSSPIPVGSKPGWQGNVIMQNVVTKKQCKGVVCQHFTQTLDSWAHACRGPITRAAVATTFWLGSNRMANIHWCAPELLASWKRITQILQHRAWQNQWQSSKNP